MGWALRQELPQKVINRWKGELWEGWGHHSVVEKHDGNLCLPGVSVIIHDEVGKCRQQLY